MNEDRSHSTSSLRERTALALALLTSEACREAFHSHLSPGKFAYAWCQLWFDEIYTPSTRYLDGIKGDRREEPVARYEAAFTDDERAALERFHRFLELRVDRLSDEDRQRAAFPQTDAWAAVVRHAAYLLEELAADPSALQKRLRKAVRALRQEYADGSSDALRKALRSVPPPDESDYM